MTHLKLTDPAEKAFNGVGKLKNYVYLSLWIHLLWIIFFASLIFVKSPPAQSSLISELCPLCAAKLSLISSAANTGKLELIGVSLTVLGVILAAAAVGSFFLIRGAAMEAASQTASYKAISWLNENRTNLVSPDVVADVIENDRIMTTLANEVHRRLSEHKEDNIPPEAANEIAANVDGLEEEH